MTAHNGDFARLQAELHSVIEIVDSNGERALVQVAADGMMRWDTLGLLDHARAVEWAATNAEAGEA